MTKPRTAAGQTLLAAIRSGITALYAFEDGDETDDYIPAAIRQIETEARAQADEQAILATNAMHRADDQGLALREALIECVKHGNIRPFAGAAREQALAVLTDTAAAAQAARERIEQPWREAARAVFDNAYGQDADWRVRRADLFALGALLNDKEPE